MENLIVAHLDPEHLDVTCEALATAIGVHEAAEDQQEAAGRTVLDRDSRLVKEGRPGRRSRRHTMACSSDRPGPRAKRRPQRSRSHALSRFSANER